MAPATISANAEVGDHVQINMGCTLGHDARIEEFATVYPGVNISGCVRWQVIASWALGAP